MAANRPSIKKPAMLSCVLAALSLGFIPHDLRAQAVDSCGPSPQVKAALDEIPSFPPPNQTEKQFREQNLSKVRGLLQRYPGDLFVQRGYIDFQSGPADRDKLIEEYKARHERSPDNVQLLHLYGLTLLGRRTPEATKLFEEALAKDAKFPWPHLALVNIYSSRNFSNKVKAVSHMKTFLGLCPATLEGYERLSRIDDRELIAQSAQKLRELIQTRSDPDAVGAYRTLWALEFKARPPAEYDQLRKHVGEDLKRVRSLNLEDKPQWYEALEEGYKLVNDQKESEWAKEERRRRGFPSPWVPAGFDKWMEDHPYPKPEDPPERKRAFYSALLKETEQWVKERPNATWMWTQRLDAMEHLEDVPVLEIEAAADRALKVAESNASPWGPESWVFFQVAEVLSKKKIHAERVVELARKGLEQLEIESKMPQSDLYADKEWTDNMNFYRTSHRLRGVALAADGYLKLGQAEKAQLEMVQFGERLKELKSLAAEKEDRQKEYSSREASYWGLMARLAEIKNRKLDAMAFYESALLARLEGGLKPEAGEKDELEDNARKLWDTLGGTDEGWNIWYGRRAAALAGKSQLTWERANEPLPSFELADLQGKTWRLADLKGRVTLLNVWASW